MNIDINRIAKLSRLTIKETEHAKFEKNMNDIVDMVNKLPDISTNESLLEPENPMILREDKIVKSSCSRSDLLANAPESKAGCLSVPKVVE
ncbi:MAG: Asp-tRNA(Asn)/Glu-tRNA(Gln) amidotransferase subunit GatC [Ruminococcus sp.]|jgi:aspartyl-tRNA(Asn)/glutamyl-tRNA(Gln) amidotransferase subunit C|nr:Asp-tRNA(Asn)/Glu-tRNA(Gln) amidotransferase subunit GatC [Ruminococcus sp.]